MMSAAEAEAKDPELELDDLTDSVASIQLGSTSREVPAMAVTQEAFVPAARREAQAERKSAATWQQKKQLSRQADASAKAWSEFTAAGQGRPAGGGVFGSKVSFRVGGKKSAGQKKHTHTAAVVHGSAASTKEQSTRTWADFQQPVPGGWDAAGDGPYLRVVQTDVATLAVGTQLRVPNMALVNGAGFVEIGRKEPPSSSTARRIVLKDPEVSSRHAQLGVSADGSLWLTDAGSKGGTLLNGQRLSASRE